MKDLFPKIEELKDIEISRIKIVVSEKKIELFAEDYQGYKSRINSVLSKIGFCNIELHENKNEQSTPKVEVEEVKEMEPASATDSEDNMNDYLRFQEDKKREIMETLVKNTNVKTKEVSNIVYGKAIKNFTLTGLREISTEAVRVVIEGTVFKVELKEIKNNKYIVTLYLTDYDYSLKVKYFVKKEEYVKVEKGEWVRVRGESEIDNFLKELLIKVEDIEKIEKVSKTDDSPEKRIELHLHTQMSAMDGVSSAESLVKRASDYGHKAVAITDHGCVQAFPDAFSAGKKNNIKIIYGVECYILNDNYENYMPEYVVFDIETTGLNPQIDNITEIGAVKIKNGKITDTFSSLINPRQSLAPNIVELTGITDEMLKDAPYIEEILPKFLRFCGNSALVAHNAQFDVGFIKQKSSELKLKVKNEVFDTLKMSRTLLKDLRSHKLGNVAEYLGIKMDRHHRALDDAKATAEIFIKLHDLYKKEDIISVLDKNPEYVEHVKKSEIFHAIILVKNSIGLKNLYKIISHSHINYFYKRPRVTKTLFNKHREGLILGTACEAGEFYRAVLQNNEEKIEELSKYYDYFEIQPVQNNMFLVNNGSVSNIEELKEINKRIVNLGEKYNKPVVATGDVHFLEDRDEIFRRILMSGQGYADADKQAPLYFRTTEEMLKEFDYIDTAYDIVVTNPNKINDMIEEIAPVPTGKYYPVIEGAEDEVVKMVNRKAAEIYGENLPEIVKKAIDKELKAIISNNYASLYLIAQKLVSKSLQDGYLVGSRGSVGSSFVAFLMGITEVNSLPPHYVCRECKYSEFIEDGSIGSGVDLKNKDCPSCGHKNMYKDGHDIPFEVFLGFEGEEKTPDIDLNFSGEYQAIAHKYTEELFGAGYVFKAGTIATIADKTAFGYVSKYFEEKKIPLNNTEKERLVQGCTGIKRTTGQHPGGIIVVPKGNEIYEFCPVQRPADDSTSDITTTHFDYHSIDQNLLKLDILGHDDPTIIRMLEDLTDVKADTIPLDDEDTLSLFVSTKALSVKPDDINSVVGTFAVPEFGTKFVRQMLIDTKPKTFAELIRISGLSHGTDVWLNNAQELVNSKTATLSQIISTRDDIMIYLMYKGLDPATSFAIMEGVRKGKGVKEEYEKLMLENGVPKWYIDSCKKIKYMFPKAHAAAYVMMAFRIAYYKVHYKMEFYTAYYTVRADEFDADIMTSEEKVIQKIKALEAQGNEISSKEKNMLTILEVCLEMYKRGIKLFKVDLYKSDSEKFLIVDGGILPPLNSLAGLGDNAARNIKAARQNREFISIEDLRVKAKISKSVVEILTNHGCLDGISKENQISLFGL